MIQTKHVQNRMNQRGIARAMVDLALAHGRCERDKYILDRRAVDQRLEEIDRERKLLLKARDKGGIVVVADDNALITAYGRH
ncbi:DUF4258 domain-containing protein [Microvirga sp. BT689]|uniref:DUF4258 domain-containing protein n=1 Tax=Microvirga arvi TaxID=2778731 RepID=UPI0019527F3D|nr:DUF4258 domain-containing protein [Microvirga arvi]MBM6582981.1 DUF4258 domain-containing protein [Microvirga arvi]